MSIKYKIKWSYRSVKTKYTINWIFFFLFKGSVPNLLWNVESQQLFSGSFDTSVVVWNVGSSQGLAVELNGHSDRLVGLSYHSLGSLLLTCSADGHIGVWPMNVKRNETPKWLQSDSCQLCSMPFFWNIREMWSKKQIGSRQVRISFHKLWLLIWLFFFF